MKKGWLKKILCAGLALTMAVSLPACGKKKDENSGLAKEHVYKYQEVALPDFGQDFSIMESIRKDGVIYLLVQVYHWNDKGDFNGNRDADIRVVSMKEDGSDVKEVTLQIPADSNASGGSNGGIAVPMPMPRAVVTTSSGSIQIATSTVTTVDEADTGTEGDSEADNGSDSETDAEDKVVVDTPVEEPMPGNVWENTNYNNFTIGADGRIYAIKRHNYSYEDYENPENSVYTRTQYLCVWSDDGSLLRETEITGLETEEESCYISDYTVDSEGNAILLISGDNIYKMIVDAQGQLSEKTKMPENLDKVFNNLDSIIHKGDGESLVIYRDENDWQKMFLAEYNMNTGVLGDGKPLPSSFGWQGYSCLKAGISADLIYSTSSGLYTLNGGDTEGTMKMDYINSDINIYGFDNVVELDENRFMGVFSESYDNTVHAGIFTYVNPEEIKDKSVLTLAGMWVGSDIKQRVVEFNRSSEDYRIVVKTYQNYNSYDDNDGGATQLNNDIISGSMPDILIVSSDIPTDNYAAKGLLADIGEMIENDEELSKVEYMTNVFESYTMNGKLHYLIPSFHARTMVGKTSIVGDRNTWTMKDMQDLMATLPEGTNLISELTRESFFNFAMQYCGSDFVDVATGKCNFNSEGFIALMEYAKTLPEELGEEYYGPDYWNNYQSQYRDNKTVLCQLYIGSVSNMNYTINGSFGEPVSYIGFPTESGQGSYIELDEAYAISAKSSHKDVAWEFLRYYLTDEYQSERTYNLPIQRKYFMERAQEATQKPYWINENGEKVEYEDTVWINGESVPIPPMSQEQVDAAVAMIESITKHPYVSNDILNIINEEMGAFFSGQKSAKEAADIIQNRVQLYVDVNG